MAELQNKPDGVNNIKEAFSIFDKNDDNGSLNMNEMKHILSRIGDKCTDEELHSFFSMFDSGSGYCKMNEISKMLQPQTVKDLYSKDIPKSNIQSFKNE